MVDPTKVFASIPAALREEVVKRYREIASNFAEHRWEPAELNGGKFCEAVYSVLEGYITSYYAAAPSKPSSMLLACQNLEKFPASATRIGDRSVRVLIPRILPALYEVRSNRGVGHVGGDVDPNFMDATMVYSLSSWVLAELIRVFHQVSTTEAQETVDVLVERKVSLVWEIEKMRRVMDPDMDKDDQVLILLYSKPSWADESELRSWVEYRNPTLFRTKILETLHQRRLIEYDGSAKRARISPLGSKHVDSEILNTRLP
jgi:hypothetical protein